jgi:hypothetical protein
MKKLMLVLAVLFFALQSQAEPREKHFIGTWKYKVETDQGDLTGTFTIEKEEGKLIGKVNTDDGETFDFSKIEMPEKDKLYMELDTGYELLELTLTLKGKKLDGTVESQGGSFPMTAEKLD